MVAAKTDRVHRALTEQFKARKVRKVYEAVVHGDMAQEEGVISMPIGRHPVARQRMSVRSRRGREAVTRWRVRERFGQATLLEVVIETGRTHQIRVHLHAIGHPVVGDPVYGKGSGTGKRQGPLGRMGRQALHARSLGFFHPERQLEMAFTSPLPPDMVLLCDNLRAGRSGP
jgi:23S rRNA pseudouridine1911/1915/1917 synthase